jgi:prevent-host-death family protein
MKIAPIAEVKAKLSQVLRQCQTEPVVITKNGRATALLVPVTDEADLERLVLVNTPRFRKLLAEAEMRIQKTGGVKHTDFWSSDLPAKNKRPRKSRRRPRGR